LHLYKGKGDLSRRKASYLMHGLSFREYLEMQGLLDHKQIEFQQILTEHESLALAITKQIKIIPQFKSYLKYGYYPFYTGNEDVYQNRLREILNLIIDMDLPYVASISSTAKEQLKRLLGAISTTVPYVPNMHKLSEHIQITDYRTLLKYLQLLEDAQLINLLRSDSKGNKMLQKPDKIYLNNTNLSHTLGLSESNIGPERETFFCNQLSVGEQVNYPQNGDFIVNHDAVFEIGGRKKSVQQIRGNEHAFVAADDIEIGFKNKIPLWLFGFLY
jgi:predicted AAA+ superfamily ATPase